MTKDKRILVFTACYNEKENVKDLIIGIKNYLPKSSILIIDDNSPDNTKNEIKNLQESISDIHLIVREKKLGLDTAHKFAYEYAISNDYDYLITMDADLSHDPKDLLNIVENLNSCPFVIGSRYVSGGKCLMKTSRLVLSKYGNLLIKKLSGINCNEFTTSYRGFDIKKLKNFNLNNVDIKGYSFFMGTLFEIEKKGFSIKEIPIIFKDRAKGSSKIPRIEIFRTIKNLLIFTLKKYL
tara:strand:- start:1268 stop:1981 length:714 start_codon:yes stop_codon:yes gene_type:complete